MKNVTTFQTATRLKNAGFPQPEPEFGQEWYYKNGMKLVCTGSGFFSEDSAAETDWQDKGSLFFAPMATDILEQLPGVLLHKGNGDDFAVRRFLWFSASEYEFELLSSHINPAEAAANAWLEKKRKEKIGH